MSDQFDRDVFANAVGTPFVAKTNAGFTLDLTLASVTDVRERPSQTSFSMIFVGPENYEIEQGLYDLEHSDLGSMQIFLVPVKFTDNRTYLEAVFTFIRTEQSSD